jgi:hypothetical protein
VGDHVGIPRAVCFVFLGRDYDHEI